MAKTIEETTGPLRQFVAALFTHIKELTGTDPFFYRHNGWYKFTDETVFLFARINGDQTRAKDCVPNSVKLQAFWDDAWESEDGIKENPKAFWGNQSAAEVCLPAQPSGLERAIKFVDTASRLHRQKQKK